jgi:hypothetical protein
MELEFQIYEMKMMISKNNLKKGMEEIKAKAKYIKIYVKRKILKII